MGDFVDSQAPLEYTPPVSAEMPARAPRRSVFREVPWRWSDVLLGFAPFLLLRAAMFLIGPRPWLVAASRQLVLPLTVLGQAWMLLVPLWIARSRTTHRARLPRLRAVLVEALCALPALPVAFGALIVVPPLVTYLLGWTEPPSAGWGSVTSSFNWIEWLTFALLAVTLAPLAEETFYRGFFYNALRQRFHPILAAVMQAAVFGYAHPFGLANSVAIGTGSLMNVLVYEWRKTLLTPILLHAAVNTLGIIFLAGSLAADAAAPRLGVFGEAHGAGCLVTELTPGSAADAAGLKPGDVITAVNGEGVADIPDLARVIRKHRLGDTVSVEFLREGKPHRAEVVLTRQNE